MVAAILPATEEIGASNSCGNPAQGTSLQRSISTARPVIGDQDLHLLGHQLLLPSSVPRTLPRPCLVQRPPGTSSGLMMSIRAPAHEGMLPSSVVAAGPPWNASRRTVPPWGRALSCRARAGFSLDTCSAKQIVYQRPRTPLRPCTLAGAPSSPVARLNGQYVRLREDILSCSTSSALRRRAPWRTGRSACFLLPQSSRAGPLEGFTKA